MVSGGVAWVDERTIPPGLVVEVRDYDVPLVDEGDYQKDEDGNEFASEVYSA